MSTYRYTEYFENEVLRKRPYLRKEWCIIVIENPIRVEVQPDDRVRFWGRIEELGDSCSCLIQKSSVSTFRRISMIRTIVTALVLLVVTISSFSQKLRYVTVISENANLRGTPSASGEIIDVVEEGETFRLVEIRGAWYLVETTNYVGWLHGNTIRLGAGQAEITTRPKYTNNDASWLYENKARANRRAPRPPVATIRPDSGTVMLGGSFRSGLGNLTISNGTSTDAIAKLVDYSIGKSYREIYIHATSSITIQNIATGSYELLFSLGDGYAPSLNKFLRNASYSKFDSLISFEETKEVIGNTIRTNYNSYRLTLNKVAGGNAKTSRISEAEFEKY